MGSNIVSSQMVLATPQLFIDFFLAKTSKALQRVGAQVDKFKAWERERVKVNYGSSG